MMDVYPGNIGKNGNSLIRAGERTSYRICLTYPGNGDRLPCARRNGLRDQEPPNHPVNAVPPPGGEAGRNRSSAPDPSLGSREKNDLFGWEWVG
jgi:hypothetical protein